MYPKEHIFLGILFSVLVFRFFPSIGLIGFLLIFLASFLIDVDHYTYYVFKQKDFSIKHSFNWHVKNIGVGRKLHILHTLDFLLVLGLLSILNTYLLYIFIGFIFHMILDVIYMYLVHEVNDRYLFFTSWVVDRGR